MTVVCPQYGQRNALVPGANSTVAPQPAHGYCRIRGYACGGSGGGTAANTAPSSGTWPAGVHCAMPLCQTRVSRVRCRPGPARRARPGHTGPAARPPTPANHWSCCGSGGGPPVAGRPVAGAPVAAPALSGVRHPLPGGHAEAEPEALAGAAGVVRGVLDRVGGLELGVLRRGCRRRPIEVRLSIASSTSGGSEMFSMMNFGICDAERRRARRSSTPASCLPISSWLRGQVQHRHLRGRQGAAEASDDQLPQELLHLLGAELRVGADQLAQQPVRVGDPQRVCAERPQPHHAELGVAEHDRVLGAPLEVGELAGVDEVDLRLERRVEPVLPALERRQDRQVLGLQRVGAGREDVGDLPLVDEDGGLRLAHDELGAHLDLVLVAREPPDDGVPAVVEPLDDVDELALDLVPQSHVAPCRSSGVQSGRRPLVCTGSASGVPAGPGK